MSHLFCPDEDGNCIMAHDYCPKIHDSELIQEELPLTVTGSRPTPAEIERYAEQHYLFHAEAAAPPEPWDHPETRLGGCPCGDCQ